MRVRAEGAGSRVDVRSLSRIGVGDLRTNAARVRAFLAAARAAASVAPTLAAGKLRNTMKEKPAVPR